MVIFLVYFLICFIDDKTMNKGRQLQWPMY